MKTRNQVLLSLGLAAALFTVTPSLRAQAPRPERSSPGDHGQDRGREAATGSSRVIREVPAPTPASEPASHDHDLTFLGFSFGPLAQWIIQLINLALFGGALWYLVKGPVKSAFASYKKDLEDRLTQAEKDKADGESQIQELEAKMAGLQAELGEILSKASVEAEAEKQRVLESARVEAKAILAAAEAEIARQQQLASQELRALVADLAVDAAASRLANRMQGAAAQTITDQAIAELRGAK